MIGDTGRLGVTYPDTESIFNGMGANGISVNEIIAVNNLKRAWQFVLENLDYPMDYPFVCKVNQIVGGDNLVINAGFIRKIPVSIGGTTWKPDIPIESQIKEEMARIMEIENETERGISLMLYLMRKQMFLDGNKRTIMLAANQVMISNGKGIISIPIEYQRDFTGLLVKYYETGEMLKITDFVYDNCIDGMDF